MDRVLSRRSYLSYANDHTITSYKPGPSCQSYGRNKSQAHVYAVSREATDSSKEMGRVIGELNKATASLGSASCMKGKTKY